MTRVDQFESVFRSASKELYHPTEVQLGHVHVLTDLQEDAAKVFTEKIKGFLSVLGEDLRWTGAGASGTRELGELLETIETQKPDLVCTYRNLFSDSWRYPYSLGEQVDVLTQVAHCPILVLPHPASDCTPGHCMAGTGEVLAMGGHMAGDHSLIDWALRMTSPGGVLRIAHIEDGQTFGRYVDAISKIGDIDTEEARVAIAAQLLKEPRDYIESVAKVLEREGRNLRIESEVRMGQRLGEYRRMVTDHTIDLLVMHTKDEEQRAMHGLAYPLAVELRETPLLLL